ncbi:ribbon-helix-helix domain-containing protein [Advenella mimigardefordensis]|uniref:ribbon-helix-helix domain-containing protein n=1 Tax=Advenella mimigardefordensis TaxID=302406 RepID=UPI00046CB906|nr:type II toxin-antitoxin system ParD family antitoxin [Advenella mimigardefordensis]
MSKTQKLSITLPLEMVTYIKNKVISGEYASEDEVITDGIRALIAKDRAIENWLRTSVVSAYDKSKDDPSSMMTVEQIRAMLKKKTDGT